jgi:hypothetical protein
MSIPPDDKLKAVVFTHINLKPEDIQQKGEHECVAQYIPLFDGYLKCHNVGLVYIYLSLGSEEIVRAIVEGRPLVIPQEILTAEQKCLAVLQLAENQARRSYSGRALKFIHVTTTKLTDLFDYLRHIDPNLFSFFTPGGVFTHDAPKFVEAVIRIARGQDPRAAFYPIVRFDSDVQVCESSLEKLLAAYRDLLELNSTLHFFFSGCYGDPDASDIFDLINDRSIHAPRFAGHRDQPDNDRIKLFWRDLGEIGATQLVGENYAPSVHGMLLARERGLPANRSAPQLVSGAGHIVSLRCAQDLPPFMNMGRLTVWIDDHLPRQLFEGIGLIFQSDLESVTEARFKKIRQSFVIAQSDDDYLGGLLAGCMMDALISQPDWIAKDNRLVRKPTEFTLAIKTIIDNPAAHVDYKAIAPRLYGYAEQRCDQVLKLWSSPEFDGTDLARWAGEKDRDTGYKMGAIASIVADAGDYLALVRPWRVSFAAAIGRLTPIANLWLFERVQ